VTSAAAPEQGGEGGSLCEAQRAVVVSRYGVGPVPPAICEFVRRLVLVLRLGLAEVCLEAVSMFALSDPSRPSLPKIEIRRQPLPAKGKEDFQR